MSFLTALAKGIKRKRNLCVIRRSSLFDAKFYLEKNPDVKASGMSAAEHYLVRGGFEGRNPSTRFYSDEYLAMYEDVRKSGMNPLLHYELYGRRERRPVSTGKIKMSQLPWTAIRQRMRDVVNVRIIARSQFFNAKWYLENNPDVAASGMDPAVHYLRHGVASGRNPSPYFVNEEYYAMHNDVRASRMNPLLHYELFGKKEGRTISLTEVSEPVFPEGSVEGGWRFSTTKPERRRTAIVASYFGKGVIPDSLLYLLKGLRDVVDNIVYVADCKVLPDEIEKLRPLVTIAKFERHGQYDFGSYRRGLAIAREEGLLDSSVANELVVINDSSYGPLYPFSESFSEMEKRDVDFWGYTGYNAFGNIHVSSYFYLFKRQVIDSGKLDEFLSGVQGRMERDKVIVKFEMKLTKFLADAGFKWDTFVPFGYKHSSPTKHPLSICKNFRMPLVKAKTVNGDSYESVDKLLEFVEEVNPSLRALIVPKPITSEHHLTTYEEHQAAFPDKCARIAEKIKRGEKLDAVFFVTSASMFPARPLFDAMLASDFAVPRIVVVPDVRWRDTSLQDMETCRNELAKTLPQDKIFMAEKDEFDMWVDVLQDADIVCYPSPYEVSSFRYNPRYAVGRNFLPICANYGFYRSIYDRHVMGAQCYAYMWKSFFECDDTVAEYRKYSAIGGTNVALVGYIKMDRLSSVVPNAHTRRRILIAPHHSVEGGTNKTLSLANFVRYADFFKALPDRYPEIDFVFRPHPFLFKIMSRPNQWGEEKTAEYVAALKAKPNVIWSDGGDYFREFAESDACIQDCGSYLVEYFYTKKPCCYMLKSPEDIEEKFAPLGKKCLENCYVAYDTDAIDGFIRDVVIGGNDPKKTSREMFADTVMVNYPHAADVALDHIRTAILRSVK